MLQTKNIITDIKQIPSSWVFETFCNLDQKLTGQTVKIKSIFTHENTPSMFISLKEGVYMFKDFSSGYAGDCISLIEKLYSCSFFEASVILKNKYQEYLDNNSNIEVENYVKEEKFKVIDYEIRQWNISDGDYWQKFNVSSKYLESHNIYPLTHFTISNNTKTYTYKNISIYGFFTNEGELYRIYQPLSKNKFFIINPIIQGYEQLDESKYCIITSSFKDLLTIKSFNIKNLTGIALTNENVMFQPYIMHDLFKRYTKVFLLLDNDDTGKKATVRYCSTYPNLVPLYLDKSKDISDSVRDYGAEMIKLSFFDMLKNNI
jgi:DNA primase